MSNFRFNLERISDLAYNFLMRWAFIAQFFVFFHLCPTKGSAA